MYPNCKKILFIETNIFNFETSQQIYKTLKQVFAVDLRNHGVCEWSDTDSFECNVVDLLHFMDTMEVPKAILVGHSLGGATAMRIAWMEVSQH